METPLELQEELAAFEARSMASLAEPEDEDEADDAVALGRARFGGIEEVDVELLEADDDQLDG